MERILGSADRILFIGAHLDDIEFGCGGTVAELSKRSRNVFLATLSAANKNAAGEIQLTRDRDEALRAAEKLGVPSENCYIGNNCFGQIFDCDQQAVREELIRLKEKYAPSVVFYPAAADIHQDHNTLAENAFRIFRNISCFGYEVIRSTFSFDPCFYYEIGEDELRAKISAVSQYASQLTQSAGYYFNGDIIRSTAFFRGGQCGLRLAEAFECYRLILKKEASADQHGGII